MQFNVNWLKQWVAIDLEPAQLRRNVTSPKGPTEQAILSLQAAGLEPLVAQAIQACARP